MIQSSIVNINLRIKGKIFLLRGFLMKKFRKKLRTLQHKEIPEILCSNKNFKGDRTVNVYATLIRVPKRPFVFLRNWKEKFRKRSNT